MSQVGKAFLRVSLVTLASLSCAGYTDRFAGFLWTVVIRVVFFAAVSTGLLSRAVFLDMAQVLTLGTPSDLDKILD